MPDGLSRRGEGGRGEDFLRPVGIVPVPGGHHGVMSGRIDHLGWYYQQADATAIGAGHVDDVLVLIGESLQAHPEPVDVDPAWRRVPGRQCVGNSFDPAQADGEDLGQWDQFLREVARSRPPGAVDVTGGRNLGLEP